MKTEYTIHSAQTPFRRAYLLWTYGLVASVVVLVFSAAIALYLNVNQIVKPTSLGTFVLVGLAVLALLGCLYGYARLSRIGADRRRPYRP